MHGNLLTALIVLATSTSAQAAGPECDAPKEGSTLQEACVLQSVNKNLDDRLNTAYGKLLRHWQSADFKLGRQGLLESQRAWLAYRNKTCALEQYVHGGIQSISLVRCIARLTEERVAYLEEMLPR